MDSITRKCDPEFVETLIDSNFDVYFGALFPFDSMIAKSLQLPFIKWTSYMPEPMVTVFNHSPWDMAMALPTMHPSGDFLKMFDH